MPRKYVPGVWVEVHDKMQSGYRYRLTARVGRNFAPDFKPCFTPKEMLAHGVFEGKYLNDCRGGISGQLVPRRETERSAGSLKVNRFGVKSRQPLRGLAGTRAGFIGDDPRGWFQWYCRYYLGRRDSVVDSIQIRRWKGIARHAAQVRKNCPSGDLACRPRQRQALLQWAWPPFE